MSKSKPKLTIEECCRQFYDKNIFHSILADQDLWSGLLDTWIKAIGDVDPSFLSIDREVFYREMTALRLEMFGLAWGHKFKQEKFTIPSVYFTSPQKAISEKFPHDIIFPALFEEFTIPQSIFTMRYLEENGKLELWDIMGEYNKVVAQSSTINESGEVTDAKLAAKVNVARAAFSKKWLIVTLGPRRVLTEEEQIIAICVGRVANRIGADIHREDKGVNVTLGLLSGIIAHRLGYDANPQFEALILLGSIALGFYNGAEEYLKSVELRV